MEWKSLSLEILLTDEETRSFCSLHPTLSLQADSKRFFFFTRVGYAYNNASSLAKLVEHIPTLITPLLILSNPINDNQETPWKASSEGL